MRKQAVEEDQVAHLLEREFHVPMLESQVYIRLVTTDMSFTQVVRELQITDARAGKLLGEQMVERGLLIRSSSNMEEYVPLHPRMVLSNIFKMYEKNLVQTLRERRASVDRVVNLLTPYYEDKKKTRPFTS